MKIACEKCAVEFDQNGGALVFENILTGERYPLVDRGTYVLSEATRYDVGELKASQAFSGGCEFVYDAFTVRWESRGAYLEKR